MGEVSSGAVLLLARAEGVPLLPGYSSAIGPLEAKEIHLSTLGLCTEASLSLHQNSPPRIHYLAVPHISFAG